ncbi:MAG: CHAT domain-containing protein [Nannocystaceae bacterium]|nr:CHAT domain-containing protein [Nannocystaceae bacterium]
MCRIESTTNLKVWLRVRAATRLRVLADGVPIRSTGRVVLDGVGLAIHVPPLTKSLQIESIDEKWDPPVILTLSWRGRAWKGDAPSLDELRRMASTHSGWIRLRLLDDIRRALDGRPESLEAGAKELKLARELGAELHIAAVLGTQARYFIDENPDLPRARALLDELEPLTSTHPTARARWHYYRGLLARRSGDISAALDHLTAARTLYEKLSDKGLLDPLEMEAITLAEIGRIDDAAQLRHKAFSPLQYTDVHCGDYARRANNLGWAELVLNSGGLADTDPRPMLAAGLERLGDCPNRWLRTSLLLELAMAEYQQGSPASALGWLAQVEKVDRDLRAWVDEVEARALTESQDPLLQPPLIGKPLPPSSDQQAWNQRVRHARALAQWDFVELAAAEYQAAEAQLSRSLARVGTDAGSELYLAGRTASLDGLVDALLELGRPGEASCAIRLARARELARLDRATRLQVASDEERNAWEREVFSIATEQTSIGAGRASLWELSNDERVQAEVQLAQRERVERARLDDALRGLGFEPTPRTCEDLRRAQPGEVILTVYASLAFATSEAGVEVAPLENLDTLESLSGVQSISIVEVGERPVAAIHTLPWRDANSLIELSPIAYSLDLRPRPPSSAPRNRALVVADPRDDLPRSRDEAAEVTRRLETRSWSVTEAIGLHATRRTLLQELPKVGLFHYAGHGVREGMSGWDSALLVAQDERLHVADVFTLRAVPRGVVLTGCETAAATPQTFGGGMNIGRAFILSGSDWVVASDAEVSDEHAAALGIAMHEADSADGPARLREALLSVRAKDPEAPWQHFRAMTP